MNLTGVRRGHVTHVMAVRNLVSPQLLPKEPRREVLLLPIPQSGHAAIVIFPSSCTRLHRVPSLSSTLGVNLHRTTVPSALFCRAIGPPSLSKSTPTVALAYIIPGTRGMSFECLRLRDWVNGMTLPDEGSAVIPHGSLERWCGENLPHG
jgi:hypothetical protein